jgi:hypothetical protein
MSNNNNIEDFEDVINGIQQIDVPIPEDLDAFVADVLKDMPTKKRYYARRFLNVAASFVAVVMALSILISSNESFAAIAKDVPVLNYLVELLTTDVGSESAMLNGYPIKNTMTFTDGDYTLIIENMMIDEERITFNANIEGPYFEEDVRQNTAFNDAPVGEPLIEESGEPQYSYSIRLADSEGTFSSTTYDDANGQKISISFAFEDEHDGYIESIIHDSGVLTFNCEIYRGIGREAETIYTFKTFSVPISEQDVLKTKYVELDQAIKLEQGDIHFTEFVVSPSKMQLIGTETPKAGYEAVGLTEKCRIKRNFVKYKKTALCL